MSNLNSTFDIVRGHEGAHNQSASYSETFKPKAGYVPQEGDLIVVDVNGEVVAADNALPGLSLDPTNVGTLAASLIARRQVWLVLSGASPYDYDGLSQTGAPDSWGVLGHVPARCEAIRGHFMFKTQNFVVKAYNSLSKVVPGTGATAGQLTLSSDHVNAFSYGQVLDYTAAATGVAGSLTVISGN